MPHEVTEMNYEMGWQAGGILRSMISIGVYRDRSDEVGWLP
jgi:hypothetical protein